MNQIKTYCVICGGDGQTGGCPRCGKTNTVEVSYSSTMFQRAIETSNIPKEFVGITWNKNTLTNTHRDKEKDNTFTRFCDGLEKFHDIFMTGNIPQKSAIIIAPKKYSKVTLAYSCMQYALASGYSVAPLLDTIEVKRLKGLMGDKHYKLYNRITCDDYFGQDIVFITVTKLINRREAYEIIMEVIHTRSRMGLPTFVISEFTIPEMSEYDRRGNFEKIHDYNGTENGLRYPAILAYSEKMNGI